MCCSYSETIIITVLKSVARIRLVKAEKTQLVLVICKAWKSATALYYMYFQYPIHTPSIVTPLIRDNICI
jgi:hypothetical protein